VPQDEIREAAGFKAVVDSMAESGKPILGHNMLLDCLHLLEQFRATLPESLQEFKQRFHGTFPQYVEAQ
jgi:poly(A)-specific ribonuclease